MQFRVLGPVEAHTDESVLLAALLRNANNWVGVDQLIDAIWHEQAAPADAAAVVHNSARQLRRAVGERLEHGPEGYRLRELDAEQAETGPAARLTLVSDNAPTVGRTGLEMLLASARREVLIISGSGNARFGRLDHENLRRGVRYRVLFPDAARLSGQLNQLSLAGAEVRTEAEVPMEGVVIDGVVAVLPADGAGAAVFRLPGVVASIAGLFERIWPGATPLIPADPEAVGPGLTSRERALLDLLCSGATDESAGARLGISVRTVRRMVADIMNRLGARSRFQAGVKLADRGWLLDKAG